MNPADQTPRSSEVVKNRSQTDVPKKLSQMEVQQSSPETTVPDLQISESPLIITATDLPRNKSMDKLEDVGEKSIPELPEGTAFYPAPTTPVSKQNISSSDRDFTRSATSLRIQSLARPKVHCLEDNIKQFGELLPKRSLTNLQLQLRDQQARSVTPKDGHAKKCQTKSEPTPTGLRTQPSQTKSDENPRKFKDDFKRAAFDRLADTIFRKLPALTLDVDITNLSQLDPSKQRMINVLFTSITSYAGMPVTVHDHELYVHLSVGLAGFFESVIETVRKGKEIEDEQRRVLTKTNQQNRHTMTTKILSDLAVDMGGIQTSREILKTMFYYDNI
ncbi:uncharacterized protein LOC129777813 [Toxorhynchites rutilus septentrionalis]|uniref:uncharacterized protein LOC129777813 n=1 Tax=Toxorhynchites rutilus septentrionalis TaxID=329112 RepID=UPI0024788691|nr:uncharacterized protein LOC129777813 [Toxorhynchites rutilus septentrionalis]